MFGNKTIQRLEEMLDSAIEGTFAEKNYDETRLSRLESRWKEFLGSSVLSNKNLESERHRLEQFISDISHQTKTPMTVIKMYTELLTEEVSRGTAASFEKIKTYSDEISRQSERLEFLIDSLTKLSRLENGTLEVVATPCRADELINAAVSAIRPKADKKKLRIELPASCSQSEQPAPQKPSASDTSDETARFDMKWTTEALVNVLDNAVKYSPEGGTIRIKIDKYEMYLAIHVIDEGHGISEEEIAKIFGRFYRGNAVQQEEGVGIGLYLTREILAKEDGYIKAVPNSERTGGELIIYLRRDEIFQNCKDSEMLL
ncbi:MAG: HAMP domain-containing histidine kinase [Spirochaetaceae bacterium]|nr:HAMP domain-containing histidine kinase [Spirochaetaceae bacterium]